LAAALLGFWTVLGLAGVGSADLIAYYPFDGNAADASGYNHQATEVTATPAAGLVGGAYYFAGSEASYIRIPHASDFSINPDRGFTIAFWVYVDPAVSKNQFTVMDYSGEWKIQAFSSGDPADPTYPRQLWFSAGPDADLTGTFATPPVGEWHHVAWKLESDGSQYILSGFLDGVSASQLTFAEAIVDGTGDLYFGKSGLGADPFTGYLDEVKIFNTALSDQEILALAQTNPVPVPGSLLLLGSGLLTMAGARRFSSSWRSYSSCSQRTWPQSFKS
jgi:hypothetical protein